MALRKLALFDNLMYFLDDAGQLCFVEGIADKDEFLIFDMTKWQIVPEKEHWVREGERDGVIAKLR